MRPRNLIISTALVGLVMWVVSGLWHNLILANFYAQAKGASHEGIGILLISYAILAFIMSYLYPLGYQGKAAWLEGLRFGMLMGILWVFPHELAMAGAHGESLTYVFKNGAWHAVEQGIGGMVLGFLYGKMEQSAEEYRWNASFQGENP